MTTPSEMQPLMGDEKKTRRAGVPSPSLLGLGLGLLVAAIALLLRFYDRNPSPSERLWTVEELAVFNGTDESLPLLLAILGSVFDVTKGRSHYGPGGGYHHFAGSFAMAMGFILNLVIVVRGQYVIISDKRSYAMKFQVSKILTDNRFMNNRDASRAFVSGNFTGDGLTDSLHGLSSTEVNSIVDWRKFYIERYIFVGKLVGRYYDGQGNRTKYLMGVEAKAKRGAQLLEKQKKEEAKVPSCNSKWSQDEGGEVWCDTGYPRLVRRPSDIALTGRINQRCACFNEEDLGQPGLQVYKGCDYLSKACPVE